MAKIVVFSDAIQDHHSRTHFSRQIVNHAAETSNEIYFVTQDDTASELLGYHSKVQILRAFRKWNLFEAAKLLPVLFQIKADIFHFVQPLRKIGLNHAYPILAAFAKTSNTQNILSLVDLDANFTHGLELMISTSRLISVLDPSQAISLQKKYGDISIECLPAGAYQDWSGAIENVNANSEPYVFLAENLHQYSSPFNVIRILVAQMKKMRELHLVCSGSLLDFDLKTRRLVLQALNPVASRVRWTGPIPPKEKLSVLKTANVVILCGLRYSPQLIHDNIGLILSAQTPALLSPAQVQTSQIPIQNNYHARVIEESQVEETLNELLNSEANRNLLRNNMADLRFTHSEDNLGNRLSRLYTKILS